MAGTHTERRTRRGGGGGGGEEEEKEKEGGKERGRTTLPFGGVDTSAGKKEREILNRRLALPLLRFLDNAI